MKHYKIFINRYGSLDAVKVGWSWPALFFIWIWAMIKGMWILGFCILLLFIIISIIFSAVAVGDTLIFLSHLSVGILFGINGNRWRENNLMSKGFNCIALVPANNLSTAVLIYKLNSLYMKDKQDNSFVGNLNELNRDRNTLLNYVDQCYYFIDRNIIEMQRLGKYSLIDNPNLLERRRRLIEEAKLLTAWKDTTIKIVESIEKKVELQKRNV